MTEHPLEDDSNESEQRINPDPPHSPGTPEVPDLDVDPEQFLDEGERQGDKQGEEDEPPS